MENITTDTEPHTMSICVDCLVWEANGDLPEDRPDYLSDLETHTGDLLVTLGRIRSEDVVQEIHLTSRLSCPWDSFTDEDGDLWSSCDCEDWDEGHFSWSSCDECGSRLGGDRFYATVWIPITNEETSR